MNNLPGKCKKNLETAFINIYFRKFPPPNPPASPCRLGRGQSPSLPLNFSGFPPGLGLPSPAPISAYLSPFSHSVLFPPVSQTGYCAHPHPTWGVCTMRSSSLTPISCCFPVFVYVLLLSFLPCQFLTLAVLSLRHPRDLTFCLGQDL